MIVTGAGIYYGDSGCCYAPPGSRGPGRPGTATGRSGRRFKLQVGRQGQGPRDESARARARRTRRRRARVPAAAAGPGCWLRLVQTLA